VAGFSRAQSVDEGLARSPVQRENSFLNSKRDACADKRNNETAMVYFSCCESSSVYSA
jgi:hypothetical protein